MFTGQYPFIAKSRQTRLLEQYQRNPERFVKGPPKVKLPPEQVLINPRYRDDGRIDLEGAVNFPTLTAAKQSLERFETSQGETCHA